MDGAVMPLETDKDFWPVDEDEPLSVISVSLEDEVSVFKHDSQHPILEEGAEELAFALCVGKANPLPPSQFPYEATMQFAQDGVRLPKRQKALWEMGFVRRL